MLRLHKRGLLVFILIAAAIYVGLNTSYYALHSHSGRDARSIYYGTRLVLSGRNPYNDLTIVGEWAHDGAPLSYKPGLPAEAFLNPPITALLFAPVACVPWQLGLDMVLLLNYVGLLVCLLLLYKMSAQHWNTETRIIFACYVLLLPSVRRVFGFGQSTLVICACLSACLYFLSRKRDGLAGVFLALSLAKFTLALPLLFLLAYWRKWKVVGVAVSVFFCANIILSMPIGLLKVLVSYTALIRETTAPGGVNDAEGSNFSNFIIISARRCFVVIAGPDHVAVQVLTLIFYVVAIISLIYVLRQKQASINIADNPLALSAVMMASLTLFYHRDYDLAALMFVSYGIIDYSFRWPQRRSWIWRLNVVGVILLSYATFNVWPFTLLESISATSAPTSLRYYTCVLVAAEFALLVWLLYEDEKYKKFPPAQVMLETPTNRGTKLYKKPRIKSR